MKQITKKKFKELHSSGRLSLCGSLWDKTKEEAFNLTKQVGKERFLAYEKQVTRIDVSNGIAKECFVYKDELFGKTLYFVETKYDNSKDRYTSRNDTQVDTVVYKSK